MGDGLIMAKSVVLKAAFSNPEVLKRLNRISVTAGTANIVNLAVANPAELTISNTFLTVKTAHPDAFFFVGTCTHSSLFSGARRQTCVAPSSKIWPRLVTVLGGVWRKDRLFFSSFQGGISMSTYAKKADPPTPSSGKAKGITPTTPVKSPGGASKKAWRSVHPADTDVPTYDGRKGFSLKNYRNLPMLHEEVPQGAAVLPLFTVTAYEANNATPKLTTAMSMNIQAIIVLADEDDGEAAPTPESPTLGILPHAFSDDEEPEAAKNDDIDVFL